MLKSLKAPLYLTEILYGLNVEGIGADEVLAFAKSVFKGYQPAFLAVKDVEKRDKIVKEIYEEIGKYLNVEKEVKKATKSTK